MLKTSFILLMWLIQLVRVKRIMLEAIILAGGLGTRLRTVVSDVPKPMAEVGGKPFLEYLMSSIVQQGITHIILAVGHKHSVIRDYFGNFFEGCEVSYSVEDSLLGTGGALLQASKILKSSATFVLLNGDTFFPISIEGLMQVHKKYEADFTVASFPASESGRYGVLQTTGSNIIVGFDGKTALQGEPANGGVYAVNPAVLSLKHPFGPIVSLEGELLPFLLSNNAKFRYVSFENFFLDIGIPRDYLSIQKNYKDIFYRASL